MEGFGEKGCLGDPEGPRTTANRKQDGALPGATMELVDLAVDGEPVLGELHEPAGEARGTLLMVPGQGASTDEFRDGPAALAERGWRVLALNPRGHGPSGGAPGHVTPERVLEDVDAAVVWLRDRGWTPAAVAGESMGASWALRALPRHDELVAGILLAPLARMPPEGASLLMAVSLRLAYYVHRAKSGLGLGALRLPQPYGYGDLFADEEDAKWAREADFGADTVDLRSARFLQGLDNAEAAREVTDPCLVVVPLEDQVLNPEEGREVHRALGEVGRKVEVEADHCTLAGRGREEVVGHIDAFLAEHLDPDA